ncbi:hypothetical protein L1049_018429 [Liquidambar formosana]|uniref:Peptidase A1 domain-containing protein n=1 Tax=Liquidambar formosana TaxID=63359 RepID=A0AAP0RA29_LIQFO
MATQILSVNILRFFHSGSLIFLCLLCTLKAMYAYAEIETTKSHQLHQSHVLQLSSLLPSSICNPSPKGTHNKGTSLKVVHKRGPCSQLTQHNTNANNLTQFLLLDQARVNSLQSRLSNSVQYISKATTVPAKSDISVGTGDYIVTVGLGTPAQQVSLIFDTGSDFTWTQCQPCAAYCHKQKEPIFDPSKSKSYTNITCSSALCSQLRSATSTSPGCSSSTCVYGISYGDGSYSVGFFGKEKLSLTSTDVFNGFLFGCGQNNRDNIAESAGLFGLGRDPLSFVSQTAQKYGKYFSYCLPSSSSSTGYLSFGGGTARDSKSIKFTPLLTNSQYASFYFINMVGISVGGQKLSIPSSVFSTARTIIDSGTVITRLPPTAYDAVKSNFRRMMSDYPMTDGISILDTCYDFSDYDTVSVPKMSFYFGGGVEFEVDLSGILYPVSTSKWCLAVAANDDDTDVAVFGNVQQLTYDVIYDVAGGKLGFGPGGCD